MYKLLLCLRYLRTRYIALASIISVMLGVATMIVVNSVMAGFSSEMRDRIHGILADVIIETTSLDGTSNAEQHMAVIRQSCGEYIEAMTATVEVYGMLSFKYHGQWVTRPITLIGIKPEDKAQVGPLVDYLDSYNAVKEKDPETGEMVVVRKALRPPEEPPGWELTDEAKQRREQWLYRQQFETGPLHRTGPEDDGPFEDDGSSQGNSAASSKAPGNTAPWKLFDPSSPAGKGTPASRNERANGKPQTTAANGNTSPSAQKSPAGKNTETPVFPSPFASSRNKLATGKKDGKQVVNDDGGNVKRNVENNGDTQPGTDDSERPLFAEEQPQFSEDHEPPGSQSPFDSNQPRMNADSSEPLEGRVYIGMGLISFPFEDPKTGRVKIIRMVEPGDDVKISSVNAGRPPKAVHFNATVVDVFKSGMSEYDSSLVFCNLDYLQQVRGMIDPSTGERSITSIQIKLKDYEHADEVVRRLKAAFPPGLYNVRTWEQKQGPLLAAVEVESAILNVLLFLIIAVAGFGILAIFFMIVVEKTKDIGVLKALGAGSGGVMSIFLSYGLALGIVGSGVGVVLGLLFVEHINTIEKWITWITGRKVFDEKIYYFPEIPTLVNPMMVVWVAAGAMAIAVLASILPARRAARLHPVQALRYE